MSPSTENIDEIISLIGHIVKNTTIFKETIYDIDNERSFENLSIGSTVDAYLENLKASAGNLEKIAKYTIEERVRSEKYLNIDTFYKDFAIVCFILLNTLNQYSESYYLVDKLYQIVSELILRSLASNISRTAENDSKSAEDENVPQALKKSFEAQFTSIAQFYQVPLKKQLQVEVDLRKGLVDRNGANYSNYSSGSTETLFSSILKKSILDKRKDQIPDEDMNFVEVLPVDISSTIDASKLGLLLASSNKRIPDPTLPATRILTKYLNPLWYRLPVNIWLKNLVSDGQANKLEHVLPIVTKNESLISSCKATDLWMKKTNYLVMYNKKEEEIKQQQSAEDDSSKLSSSILIKKHAALVPGEDYKINLKNLSTWSELHYYSDEELKVLTEGQSLKGVQDLVNKYLSKLVVLQQKRLKHTLLTKPQPTEIELYHKIQNLLKMVLLYGNSEQIKALNIPTTKTVPVLQANYSGSLPAKKLPANQSSMGLNNPSSQQFGSSGKYRPKKYRKH